MANSFLDKTGLSYFWSKIKVYVDGKFYSKTGGSLDGDITFVKKEGQTARTIGFGNTGADGTRLTFSANVIQFSGPDGSSLAMSGKKIQMIGDATQDTDAVTLGQLKARTPSIPISSNLGYVATVVEDGKGGVEPGWQKIPSELPEGGTEGQILSKTASGVQWADAPTSSELKSVSVTLAASSWVDSQASGFGDSSGTAHTQTVTVEGILADESAQLIQPIPKTSFLSDYISAGILCTAQAANSLTFTCETVPTSDISLYVVFQDVVSE